MRTRVEEDRKEKEKYNNKRERKDEDGVKYWEKNVYTPLAVMLMNLSALQNYKMCLYLSKAVETASVLLTIIYLFFTFDPAATLPSRDFV